MSGGACDLSELPQTFRKFGPGRDARPAGARFDSRASNTSAAKRFRLRSRNRRRERPYETISRDCNFDIASSFQRNKARKKLDKSRRKSVCVWGVKNKAEAKSSVFGRDDREKTDHCKLIRSNRSVYREIIVRAV